MSKRESDGMTVRVQSLAVASVSIGAAHVEVLESDGAGLVLLLTRGSQVRALHVQWDEARGLLEALREFYASEEVDNEDDLG